MGKHGSSFYYIPPNLSVVNVIFMCGMIMGMADFMYIQKSVLAACQF